MKQVPNHRFLFVEAAVSNGAEPRDTREAELRNLLRGETVDAGVTRAYDIYTHTYKREILESFLLVGTDAREIDQILRITPAITEVYTHLFFDTTVFEDELDRIEYAHGYARNEFGSEMKKFAIELGRESLKVRVSRGTYVLPPTAVQNEIRSTAFILAQRAKINPIDSEVSKEAFRWAQLALKASIGIDTNDVHDIERLQIALDTRDETTNEERSGIEPATILH